MMTTLTNAQAGLGGMLLGALILGLIGHFVGQTTICAGIGMIIGLFGAIHGNDPTWVGPK